MFENAKKISRRARFGATPKFPLRAKFVHPVEFRVAPSLRRTRAANNVEQTVYNIVSKYQAPFERCIRIYNALLCPEVAYTSRCAHASIREVIHSFPTKIAHQTLISFQLLSLDLAFGRQMFIISIIIIFIIMRTRTIQHHRTGSPRVSPVLRQWALLLNFIAFVFIFIIIVITTTNIVITGPQSTFMLARNLQHIGTSHRFYSTYIISILHGVRTKTRIIIFCRPKRTYNTILPWDAGRYTWQHTHTPHTTEMGHLNAGVWTPTNINIYVNQ